MTRKCEYVTCEREARVLLRFDKLGTPLATAAFCQEHVTTEQIHNPHGTTTERLLDTTL